MTDLAASDITVTINSRKIRGSQREVDVTIAFGDGALEIPTTGVPLPAISKFGMVKELRYVYLYQPTDAAGRTWYVDTEDSVITIAGKISVKGTVAALTVRGVAIGW